MRRLITTTLLLIVPLFLTGCSLKKTPSQVTVSPSSQTSAASYSSGSTGATGATYVTIDPTTLDAAIKTNYEFAEQKVKEWHRNAVLYQVSAKLPGSLAVGQVTEVYTYGSADDAYNWWTLSISEKTAKSVRAIIPKEDYLGTTLKPVPLQHWKMNYIQALQLAEANGGSAYRGNHTDSQVTINLAIGPPKDFLWWSVEYESPTAATLTILVNPSTKEVVTPSPAP